MYGIRPQPPSKPAFDDFVESDLISAEWHAWAQANSDIATDLLLEAEERAEALRREFLSEKTGIPTDKIPSGISLR